MLYSFIIATFVVLVLTYIDKSIENFAFWCLVLFSTFEKKYVEIIKLL